MAIIEELPVYPEHKEEFTCKRCGSHLYREISVVVGKFAGEGIGSVKMKVCANCFNGTDLEF